VANSVCFIFQVLHSTLDTDAKWEIKGWKIFFKRKLQISDSAVPFIIKWWQFPVKVAFLMVVRHTRRLSEKVDSIFPNMFHPQPAVCQRLNNMKLKVDNIKNKKFLR
jgi:hypothetical protein